MCQLDRANYVLRVKGDSMIDDGIRDGDYVLVEKRYNARDGETVVAILESNDATLGQLRDPMLDGVLDQGLHQHRRDASLQRRPVHVALNPQALLEPYPFVGPELWTLANLDARSLAHILRAAYAHRLRLARLSHECHLPPCAVYHTSRAGHTAAR